MSNYKRNKKLAITTNVGTTKTDQSQAASTDINIIVRNAMIHGTAPGSKHAPMYGDFSQMPDNLRDMIELGRTAQEHKASLPPALRNMTIEELVTAAPEQLNAKFAEEALYIDRHTKLPAHLKSLGRHDLIHMSEQEFRATIEPRNPATPPDSEKTK